MTSYLENEAIILKPRPLALSAGVLILLPLLPKPQVLPSLPIEVWQEILFQAIEGWLFVGKSQGGVGQLVSVGNTKWNLALVCKQFKVSHFLYGYRQVYRTGVGYLSPVLP